MYHRGRRNSGGQCGAYFSDWGWMQKRETEESRVSQSAFGLGPLLWPPCHIAPSGNHPFRSVFPACSVHLMSESSSGQLQLVAVMSWRCAPREGTTESQTRLRPRRVSEWREVRRAACGTGGARPWRGRGRDMSVFGGAEGFPGDGTYCRQLIGYLEKEKKSHSRITSFFRWARKIRIPSPSFMYVVPPHSLSPLMADSTLKRGPGSRLWHVKDHVPQSGSGVGGWWAEETHLAQWTLGTAKT
ncbi:hypothetical protein BGZ63DRAFT_393864 [Mariannaea sp. PMI_226]|nr:hypothetical protein BGZ63DRAFT_393864 [Mariannaea sp. PMI_226]